MGMTTKTFAALATLATILAAPAAADTTTLHPFWVDPATGEGYRDVVLVSESNLDVYPQCAEEDCSDQPGQVGVWLSNEGNSYLELGEGATYLVIDDTVR
jgi:hypothetical protein